VLHVALSFDHVNAPWALGVVAVEAIVGAAVLVLLVLHLMPEAALLAMQWQSPGLEAVLVAIMEGVLVAGLSGLLGFVAAALLWASAALGALAALSHRIDLSAQHHHRHEHRVEHHADHGKEEALAH